MGMASSTLDKGGTREGGSQGNANRTVTFDKNGGVAGEVAGDKFSTAVNHNRLPTHQGNDRAEMGAIGEVGEAPTSPNKGGSENGEHTAGVSSEKRERAAVACGNTDMSFRPTFSGQDWKALEPDLMQFCHKESVILPTLLRRGPKHRRFNESWCLLSF